MFKIGVFSRFSQVPVKTLRYCDQTGLLKPAEVDPFTGYRSYSASQLPRVYRILALKDLGLFLDQIAVLFVGPIRKVYAWWKEADTSQNLTEIQLPVAEA